ncbi:helix-turn-helix transcriptional regulator [Oxalobacter vibrioformis]|uniref:Helix-turn-helix transcriptional regulator n=1 Tax=Oxalobacter vibrioformis TaxID=933080 RepID=A0A9E9P344_9BURK|nr:helix-turn-helix transcriptional regulator [Oxalobacter vibrioformis]WAW10604.1 helix-turn-helix transcriptional regulator [Oxalobacter vibrioformis]
MGSSKLLGGEIRRRRLELGLSQEELATLCDLHRTYIGSVERGERNVSLQNIVSIAYALKYKPSQLMAVLDEAS